MYCSVLPASAERPEFYELELCVKEYRFAREDPLIGLLVLQLGELLEAAEASGTAGPMTLVRPLARGLFMDDTGYTILRILGQRLQDEVTHSSTSLCIILFCSFSRTHLLSGALICAPPLGYLYSNTCTRMSMCTSL